MPNLSRMPTRGPRWRAGSARQWVGSLLRGVLEPAPCSASAVPSAQQSRATVKAWSGRADSSVRARTGAALHTGLEQITREAGPLKLVPLHMSSDLVAHFLKHSKVASRPPCCGL